MGVDSSGRVSVGPPKARARLTAGLLGVIALLTCLTNATALGQQSGQRHHVANPGVPSKPAPPAPYPYIITDPFFEMSGVRIAVTQPTQHRYMIKVFAQPAANSYPRGGDGLLTVPVWRNRNHRWCWIQTLLVPIGAPTASTFDLNMTQFAAGDALMLEDWPAVSWEIDVDGLAAGMRAANWNSDLPRHRDDIHADCSN